MMKIYLKNKKSDIFNRLFSILKKLEKIEAHLCAK